VFQRKALPSLAGADEGLDLDVCLCVLMCPRLVFEAEEEKREKEFLKCPVAR
jgi:hypothetical protein